MRFHFASWENAVSSCGHAIPPSSWPHHVGPPDSSICVMSHEEARKAMGGEAHPRDADIHVPKNASETMQGLPTNPWTVTLLKEKFQEQRLHTNAEAEPPGMSGGLINSK